MTLDSSLGGVFDRGQSINAKEIAAANREHQKDYDNKGEVIPSHFMGEESLVRFEQKLNGEYWDEYTKLKNEVSIQ